MGKTIKKYWFLLNQGTSSINLFGGEVIRHSSDNITQSWINVGGFFRVGFDKAKETERFSKYENCDNGLRLN